jgi:hypothetical protein
VEVTDWVKKLNEDDKVGTFLKLEWIDPCLTSIYQPGDISINKPLKEHICAQYYQYVTEASTTFIPGEKITVSRETLVGFVEQAFTEINDAQEQNASIFKSFRTCGLDPWTSSLSPFHKHLECLSENKIYECLLQNHAALELSIRKE